MRKGYATCKCMRREFCNITWNNIFFFKFSYISISVSIKQKLPPNLVKYNDEMTLVSSSASSSASGLLFIYKNGLCIEKKLKHNQNKTLKYFSFNLTKSIQLLYVVSINQTVISIQLAKIYSEKDNN